jgi:diguanylate cyclase (GGDEF)-like protein/PAS domain S-box-containing protein
MFTLDPQLVALAQENTRTATWEWTEATDELRWTSGQSEIYSRPAHEINCTEAWESLVHPDDRSRLRSAVENALRDGTGYRERFRVAGKDGATLWILGYAQVVRDPDHGTRLIGVNLDMTDWVEALIASETRFTATFEQAAVGIAHVALDGTWLNVNRRCAEIVGYPKEVLLGLNFSDITHPDDLEADWALVRDLLEGQRDTYSLEKRYFTRDRRLVWVNLTVSLVRKPDGSPDYFISVIEDITLRKQIEDERDELIVQLEERVRQRTAELERLTLTDPLTGIANRRSFDRCLEAEWDRAVRTRQPLSLILVDIDFFKNMNDSAGHSAADDALRAVAACLSQVAQRSADLAARYGGDEFVLILPDTSAEGALRIANRVQELIEELKVRNPGSAINTSMTVSQGAATASPDAKGTWSSLLLDADRALYRAKQTGRARIAVAEPGGA